MELELSRTLSTELGCIVSIADQCSALTRDFFGVTFPLKYIFLNPFDLSVLIGGHNGKKTELHISLWKHSQCW